MTGPEFALSIIGSMIAAVLYDMLRNPSPPVFKDEPHNTQRILRFLEPLKRNLVRLKSLVNIKGEMYLGIPKREEAKILLVKKEDSPRPTLSPILQYRVQVLPETMDAPDTSLK